MPPLDPAQVNLTSALAYASLRFPVFPVNTDKTPATPHGFKDATLDRSTIEGWWGNGHTHAGVGIATGRESGLLVLDIDPAKGGSESLQDLITTHGPLPDTVTCRTGGGGIHYYFALDTPTASATNLWPGVDVRADGGYVVAPFSSHPTGARYRWAPGHGPGCLPLAQPPAWLLEALRRPQAPPGPQPAPPGTYHAGDRHRRLLSLGGSMQRRGMSPAAILAALLAENRDHCSPPKPDHEVARLASDITNRYPAVEPAAPQPLRGMSVTFAPMSQVYGETLTDPPWVYEGWLTLRDRVAFTGAMYLGKSFISADLAISLVTGKPWLGIPQTRGPFRVVYLDRENPPDLAIRYRLPRMLAAAGVTDPSSLPLFYSDYCNVTLREASDVNQLADILRPLRPDFVIVDTLIRFHTGEENSNSDMAKVMGHFDLLGRELGAGIICQAHPGKADPATIRGASDIAYSQNTLWTLEKEDNRLLFRSRKVRWGTTADDIEVAIRDTPHTVQSGAMGPHLSGIAVEALDDSTSYTEMARAVHDRLLEVGPAGTLQSELIDYLQTYFDLSLKAAQKAAERALKQVTHRAQPDGRSRRLWSTKTPPTTPTTTYDTPDLS